MDALLEMLLQQFDAVVVDGPPVVSAPDAVLLARSVQSTLLILSPDRTSRRSARQAIDSLASWEDVQVVGAVLNRTSPDAYTYGYYYGRAKGPSQGLVQRLVAYMWPKKDSGLVSISQVASMLDVKESTVKRWCEEGRLPAVKRGLTWWVHQEELENITADRFLGAN
jgi:excisionase family DNA binding protein